MARRCSRLADLPQEVDGDRGDEVGRAVEVQRQVDLVGVEERSGVPEPGGDPAEDGEHDGRERRGAVGHQRAELVGPLQLVLGHQVRDGGRGRRVPELRRDPGEELRDEDPGQVREQRDRDEQQAADHVADDHRDPPVEPVGERARDRPEQQRGQQRDHPYAADRRGLRQVAAVRHRRRERDKRQDGQPVAQAGQRQRDPQRAERPDREHSVPGARAPGPAARRRLSRAGTAGGGAEVHGVRLSISGSVPGHDCSI